jgi:superfamily II DNA helicase RecQ
MTKKINKVRYSLNPCKKPLPQNEINKIIRAADDLVYAGGRSLLAKVLKGSKDKSIMEHGLDKNSSYGAFKDDTIETITSKIDWMIENFYLDIEYDYRLPLIVYRDRGLDIAKDLISDEFLEKIKEAVNKNDYQFALSLKDKNRNTIFLLLDKIRRTGNDKLIPFLAFWKEHDYKKVRQRINSVINDLNK